MTKTSVRVHRNGGAKVVSPQARKTTQPNPGRAPQHLAPVTLTFWSHATNKNVGNLDIPGAKFRSLEAAARRAGRPVDEFMEIGIGRMLEEIETELRQQDAARKLAQAAARWLRRQPGMRRCAVMVDEGGDFTAEIAVRIARVKTVIGVSVQNEEDGFRLAVGLFQNPALRSDEPAPAVLANKVQAALNQWQPTGWTCILTTAPVSIPDKFLSITHCKFTLKRRYRGFIKTLVPGMDFGFISIARELQRDLGLNSNADLFFGRGALASEKVAVGTAVEFDVQNFTTVNCQAVNVRREERRAR